MLNRNKSVVDVIYYDINYDYRENGYLKLTHYLYLLAYEICKKAQILA